MFPNTFASNIQYTITLAVQNIVVALVNFTPQLIGAIAVLLLGLVVSSWFKVVFKEIIQAINISRAFKHTQFHPYFSQADIRKKLAELFGEGVKWLTLYIFTIAALNVVGLTTVSTFLTGLLGLIPNIVAAGFIFIVGVLLAGVAESLIKNAIIPFDPATARFAGKGASYTVVVLGSLIALSELGIGDRFIQIVFIGFIAMISLSFGLALGLGSKDLVKDSLSRWYQKYTKERLKNE
jgi:hypothetical protein